MVGLGTGIYTPGEAAALLHQQAETVRRWAFGYRRARPRGSTAYPPLIHTELPDVEGERALTFVELIELLYVRAFTAAGVPWHAIRQAASVAARLYDTAHPFALRQLYLDPKSLYGLVEEQDGSESLVQLVGHGQHAITALVKPYLDQLDFDLNDVARRWWPLGRIGGVVLDPAHSFGAPVVEETGIRAHTLANTYDAELPRYGDRTLEHVAWMYEIQPRQVEAALRFRSWLRSA